MFFYSIVCHYRKKLLLLLLLLLLLSRFSRVRLCATPWMAAHQAPPSLGLSSLPATPKSPPTRRVITGGRFRLLLQPAVAPATASLPGESQGRGSLVGCHPWGRTESDTTEVT